MKFHLSLNTQTFDHSVRFYQEFLGVEPVKLKPGYAKFDLEEPPLNLTLNQQPPGKSRDAAQAINHLGFQVTSTDAVDAARKRLEEAGMASWSEHDTDCCHALQDKVWVKDPDGNAWEIFVVKVADTTPELSAKPATMTSVGCC